MTEWLESRVEGLTPEELSQAIFAGRILQFEDLAPMEDLVAAARRCIEDAFADIDPLTAHQHLETKDYAARYAAIRKAFLADTQASRALEAALVAAGADPHTTYRDRPILRVSPPDTRDYRPGYGAIPAHRDTWGSGISCQINWWLPVYPVTAERTLAIFPAHWSKKIENDSEGWDWHRAGKDPETPLLPTALAELDRSGEIRLVPEPGTLVAFSGAHLHASVPNSTPLARFSCETRTVSAADLRAGRGAPNIDGAPVEPAFSWFSGFNGGESLASDFAANAGLA